MIFTIKTVQFALSVNSAQNNFRAYYLNFKADAFKINLNVYRRKWLLENRYY